jgi:hypothetical protein
LLKANRIVALSETTAGIVTQNGARQTYRRRPLQPGEMALAWDLVP